MRALVVVRHAKAGPQTIADHERPLVEKGHRQAASIGVFLSVAQIVPDVALVSSAARTRQTWELLSAAGGFTCEPQIRDELYTAGPSDVLRAVRAVDAAARTVVVIGHNPTMHQVAHDLDAAQGDAEAVAAVRRGYPTGATAVFEVPCSWADLELGDARITAFHAP